MQSEKQKAMFLDRDGVLIKERGDYTWNLEDMSINEGVAEALLKWQEEGFLLIVISNQSGIGKGLYTKADVDFLHFHMKRFLSSKGIFITEIYYCPHHPSTSNCLCRKPGSLMLEKAIARFNIDGKTSYFIGDAERDFEAGVAAGVIPIRLDVNGDLRMLKIVSKQSDLE